MSFSGEPCLPQFYADVSLILKPKTRQKSRYWGFIVANTDQQAWSLQSVQDAYNALVTNGALPNPQSVSPDSALLSDSQHIYHSNTGRRLKFSFSAAAGTRYYPRLYGAKKGIPTDPPVVTALDAIPECKTGQTGQKFLEFPLNMPVFTGGDRESQGPGRVIPISPSPGQGIPRTFTYCLAITHRGGKGHEDSPFRPCTIVWGVHLTVLGLGIFWESIWITQWCIILFGRLRWVTYLQRSRMERFS